MVIRCSHRRKKKIFTHGKKSPSMLICKDCGKVLERHQVQKAKQKKQQRRKK